MRHIESWIDVVLVFKDFYRGISRAIRQQFCRHSEDWARAVHEEQMVGRSQKKRTFKYRRIGYLVYCPKCKYTFFGADTPEMENLREWDAY